MLKISNCALAVNIYCTSDSKHYKAILVIPDIYNRLYIKELVSLLLCRLGFGGCFLLQDHVASTFGAGLGAACVVDLGDQKTSVSCVEDALSQRATRVRFYSFCDKYFKKRMCNLNAPWFVDPFRLWRSRCDTIIPLFTTTCRFSL